jgi:hypothetical protein
MKYQKGNTLAIMNNSTGHGYPIGTIVRVIEVLKKNYIVSPVSGLPESRDCIFGVNKVERYAKDSDFTLEPNIVPKFKDSDIAYIIKNTNHPIPTGSKVDIISNYIFSNGKIVYMVSAPDSSRWYVFESDLSSTNPNTNNNSKIETMTKQTMKDAVLTTAKALLVANNTITTLEIKLQLIKDFPYFYWKQVTVSELVDELVTEGKLTVVDDNGTYRTYADPTQPARTGNIATGNSTGKVTVTTKKVASTPTIKAPKGKTISATKAVELMKNNKGRFFTVTFTKKDQSQRTLNGQWVKDQKTNAKGYVLVKDAAKMKKTPTDCIRNVNLQTLHSISINGSTYRVQ